jgi:two-component system sensor histidine kinase RegB
MQGTLPHLSWFIQFRWLVVLTQFLLLSLLTNLTRNETALWGFALTFLSSLMSTVLISIKKNELKHSQLGPILLFDTAVLTLLLYFSGGAHNPFSLFFVTQVALAAILIGERWTWIIAILSSICYGALFFFSFELSALSPHSANQHDSFSLHLQGMWIAFSILAATQAVFFTRIVRALGEREAELRELSTKAQRSERLASVTALAASAAHELNTPLSSIKLSAGEIVEKLSAMQGVDALKSDAALILAEVTRCSAVLERLRQEAGDIEGQIREEVPFEDIVSELRGRLSNKGAERVSVDEASLDLSILSPRRPLIEALSALVKNALESTPGALVDIKATRNQSEQKIVVRDNGGGLPPEILGRIGEPFFTTKDGGRGLGLGVFLARSFIEKLGGSLSFRSEKGLGTEAILIFPVENVAV